MTRIILASQSQPRIELLAKTGIKFDAISSNYEEHLDESKPAEAVAKTLALGKALNVAALHLDACDTVVGLPTHLLHAMLTKLGIKSRLPK